MTGWARGFELDREATWLNCSHQGALPSVAAQAAREAIEWKLDPRALTQERFDAVPERVRRAAARWIGADPADLFLASGASQGLHQIAAGMPLDSGNEVLVMRGDFPANILPWLVREREGVIVRQLQPLNNVLTTAELAAAIGPKTAVVCLSWVHSFSGWTLPIAEIGALCRAAGIRLIVNVSQGLGARPFDPAQHSVDALVCAGWKWLCGPYAVGFGWLAPEFRSVLRSTQRYWLAQQTASDLAGDFDPTEQPAPDTIRRWDLFGTANFFNFHPWGAALEYLWECGPAAIEAHDRSLVQRLVDGLPPGYELLSPAAAEQRSTLVVFTHRDASRNAEIYRRLGGAGIHIAFRRGALRAAPHLYNDASQIDRLLTELDRP